MPSAAASLASISAPRAMRRTLNATDPSPTTSVRRPRPPSAAWGPLAFTSPGIVRASGALTTGLRLPEGPGLVDPPLVSAPPLSVVPTMEPKVPETGLSTGVAMSVLELHVIWKPLDSEELRPQKPVTLAVAPLGSAASAAAVMPAAVYVDPWVIVLLAFFVLSVQLFITIIEFKLTVLAGFVLVPFALFGQTAFLAERVLGNVISSGIKLMVLAIIVVSAFPAIATWLPDAILGVTKK